MYIEAFKDSRGEARKSDDSEDNPHKVSIDTPKVQIIENKKNLRDYAFEFASFAFVVAVIVFLLWVSGALSPKPEPEAPKPKTEIEILADELNRLNTESIDDAGACARNEARNARKSEILKKINYFK